MRSSKFFVIISLLCIFAGLLSACSTDQGAAGSTESTDGVLLEVHDDSGNLTGYERRYSNTDGLLSRLDVYDVNNEYDHYVLYEYDSSGRLSKETTYKANGIGDFFYEYTYDEDDNIIQKDYFSQYDGGRVIIYNASGEETERFFYDTQGDLIRHEKLETDEIWHFYDADDNELTE